MQITLIAAVLFGGYLIGSIPWGLIIVKLTTGKDIRQIESGRTGGTNAMRAAGVGAGVATVVLDFLKGAAAVWLVRGVLPGHATVEALAPLMAVLGHNYSIFLLEIDRKTGLRLRGGAGGATCVGGSFGLWPLSALFILPLAGVLWYGVGYASVTTMSVGLAAAVLFGYRASLGLNPWSYALYALLAEVFMIWTLRPNIQRLMNGTERLHGWRARRKQKTGEPDAPQNGSHPG